MNCGMPDNWWYWNCLIKDLLNEGHIWPLIFVMLCWGIFQDIFTFCILCFMEKHIMWTYLILGILRKEYYFKLFYDFKYRFKAPDNSAGLIPKKANGNQTGEDAQDLSKASALFKVLIFCMILFRSHSTGACYITVMNTLFLLADEVDVVHWDCSRRMEVDFVNICTNDFVALLLMRTV